ncbi:THAP domain-containing protein 7 [Amphiprion ocellaris]|uniref:THAP domain-containing protein 7 n=1 Tax=Amphiprion ocellaris TaxID=80972 RepID=UPI000C3062DB|nr:THAP domain-containing protein 7 [Amphiprion ocellaris]
MPRHCSAGGCKCRDNRETRNAGITFHKLPKGATRRKLWITNSHRADSWDPQTDFVYFCSRHFTPESFELTGCSGIKRLKEDAFPTVFDFSSAAKCKRAGTLQKQDIPVRKSSCSGEQESIQQENNHFQAEEEPAVQRSVEADEETNENILEHCQESGMEQPSQQGHNSLPPEARPLSPSHYMKRLPPPPGFYLSKEHSYAQLCPLLWRRRYDQVVDCLEKALRQLHAARRRENRLRGAVLRLREKRLKHTLVVSRGGWKSKRSWTSGREKIQFKVHSDQEESETDAKSETTGLFVDRYVNQLELGCQFLPDTSSWSEVNKAYCFYCGRGEMQIDDQVACRVSNTFNDVQSTEHSDSMKIPRSVESSTCSPAQNAKDLQTVRLERPPRKYVETSDTSVTKSQVMSQNPSHQHVTPAGMSPPDTHEQSLHFLGSQQKLVVSDICKGDSEGMDLEHQLDLQQRVFWIQDSAEGPVILVPVPTEDGSQSFLKMEGVADKAQARLVPELDQSRDEICDDEHSDQYSVINSTSVEMKEDVRKKLKEHLEGFHLQLSTEFRN